MSQGHPEWVTAFASARSIRVTSCVIGRFQARQLIFLEELSRAGHYESLDS